MLNEKFFKYQNRFPNLGWYLSLRINIPSIRLQFWNFPVIFSFWKLYLLSRIIANLIRSFKEVPSACITDKHLKSCSHKYDVPIKGHISWPEKFWHFFNNIAMLRQYMCRNLLRWFITKRLLRIYSCLTLVILCNKKLYFSFLSLV